MAHKQAIILKLVEAEKMTREEFEEEWDLEPEQDSDPDEQGFSIVDYAEEPNLEGFDDGAVSFIDSEKFADIAVRLDKLPCPLAMLLAMQYGCRIAVKSWLDDKEGASWVTYNHKTKEFGVHLHGMETHKYGWSPSSKEIARTDFIVLDEIE